MKLLILDRDGVINEEREQYILSANDWKAIPGSLEAISRAKNMGFYIVVISNQSALGRGWMSMDDLNSINRLMQSELAKFGGKIDIFLFCPHPPEVNCDCRKPKVALLEKFKRRIGRDLGTVPFIGDRMSDIETAKLVGAHPILVRSGKPIGKVPANISVYADLSEALHETIFKIDL